MLVEIIDYTGNLIAVNLDKILYVVESRTGDAKAGWKSYIRIQYEGDVSSHIMFKEESDAYDTVSILAAIGRK